MWAATLEQRLSQGDLLRAVLCTDPVYPSPFLQRKTFGGNHSGFAEAQTWKSDHQGIGLALSKGRFGPALVLSHSCDLDKEEKKGRALIAPVLPFTKTTPEKDRQAIMTGGRLSAVPLLGTPEIGDCYADLRMTTFVDRRFTADRVASMTERGRARIHRHIVGFFVRLDLDTDDRDIAQLACLSCGSSIPDAVSTVNAVVACPNCGRQMKITAARPTTMVKITLL